MCFVWRTIFHFISFRIKEIWLCNFRNWRLIVCKLVTDAWKLSRIVITVNRTRFHTTCTEHWWSWCEKTNTEKGKGNTREKANVFDGGNCCMRFVFLPRDVDNGWAEWLHFNFCAYANLATTGTNICMKKYVRMYAASVSKFIHVRIIIFKFVFFFFFALFFLLNL